QWRWHHTIQDSSCDTRASYFEFVAPGVRWHIKGNLLGTGAIGNIHVRHLFGQVFHRCLTKLNEISQLAQHLDDSFFVMSMQLQNLIRALSDYFWRTHKSSRYPLDQAIAWMPFFSTTVSRRRAGPPGFF